MVQFTWSLIYYIVSVMSVFHYYDNSPMLSTVITVFTVFSFVISVATMFSGFVFLSIDDNDKVKMAKSSDSYGFVSFLFREGAPWAITGVFAAMSGMVYHSFGILFMTCICALYKINESIELERIERESSLLRQYLDNRHPSILTGEETLRRADLLEQKIKKRLRRWDED